MKSKQHKPTKRRLHRKKQDTKRVAHPILCTFFSIALALSSVSVSTIMQFAMADEEQAATLDHSDTSTTDTSAAADGPSSDEPADQAEEESSSGEFSHAGDSQDETSDEDSSASETSDTADVPAQQNDEAASSTDDSASDALVAMAGSVDLNRLWRSQDGGTSAALTIKEGGTYALTADLRVTGCMMIDAPDKDVVIDLRTYCLSAKQPTSGYLIRASDCASLTIRGTRPLAGISPDGQTPVKDQIVIDEGDLRHAIEFLGKNLVVENVGIALKSHKDYAESENIDACGVYVTKGDARIANCGILVDHSIQANVYSNSSSFKGFPKALYLGKEAGACSLEHSSLTMQGSPVTHRPKSVVYKATTFDNAYGIYSETDKTLTVQGGSISADSALGSATGIYAKSVSIKKSSLNDVSFSAYNANPDLREQARRIATLTISAEGGDQAYGISVSDKGQAVLDAPVLFKVSESDTAPYKAALREANENSFVFGKDFDAQHATVIAGAVLTDANRNGLQLGSFSTGVDQQNRQRIAGSLENGLEDGVCAIRIDGNKLLFTFEEERAPAVIVDGNGNERSCESVDQALMLMGLGDTVKLLKDGASVTIDAKHLPDLEGLNDVAFDLNGHTITNLVVNIDKSVRVFSSASQRGTIRTSSGQDEACVVHRGTGSLSLADIDVIGISQYRGAGSVAYGINESSRGMLSLSDVGLRVVSDTSSATGIYQAMKDSSIRIENSTISVSSETPGVNVTGITQSTASSLALINTAVDVRSYDGATAAIEVRGELEAQGGSLAASTRKASTSVSAVRLMNGTALASLTGVSCSALCTDDSVDSGYFCLMAGNAQPSNNGAWVLNGTCSFTSSTNSHINHKGTPLILKSGFASADKVVLLSVGLEDDKAIEFEGNPAQATVSSTCTLFEPHDESDYYGCSLMARDDGALHWKRALLVHNASSDISYASLAEAFAKASAGDVIDLLGDVRETSCLAMPAGLTLDLAGHTLELDVPATAISSDSLGIISMTGTGNSLIKNGQVVIASELARAFLNSQRALIAVGLANGADLDLEDATIRFDVTGDAVSASGSTQIVGINAPASAVELSGSSSVELNLDTSQPMQAQAISVGAENATASLLLGADASAVVNDRSQRQSRGSIWHPGLGVNKQTLNLIRFYPDEASPECEAFQERFKEEAKVDIASDTEGYAYGTSLYYAVPLEWSDDTNIFAFSKPLSSEKIGYLKNIRADVFFSQTYYDDVPHAQAITVTGSNSSARIDGRVTAASEHGNACALSVDSSVEDQSDDKPAVEVSSVDALTANASTESYREQLGEIDFRTALGVTCDRNPVYPADLDGKTGSSITYREVQQVLPTAQRIAGSDASFVTILNASSDSEDSLVELQSDERGESASTIETLTEPMRLMPETVEVTFGNLRNSDGSSKDAIVRTQAFGSTVEEGGALPVPADYASNGVTYRFVGWRIAQSTQGSGARSAESISSMRLDRSAGAAQGTLTLNAVYVPVQEGQHLIIFKADSSVIAYAVDDGQRPEYRNALAGADVSVPTIGNSYSGVLTSFRGWKASSEDMESTPTLKGLLPKAHEDRTYIATFSETPRKGYANFYTWQMLNGKLTYTFNRAEIYFGETGVQKANALAKPGSLLYSDDVVYEFKGWAPRQSDKEPFYELTPPVLTSTSSVKSIYGVYSMRPRTIRVNFYVDGKLYAQSPAMLGTVSLNAAFNASKKDKPADKSKELRFRGWSLVQDDSNYIRGAVRSLASLTEGEKAINVYAVYGEAVPEEETTKDPAKPNLGQSYATGSGSGATDSAGPAPIYATAFTPISGLSGADLAASVKAALSLDGEALQGDSALSTLGDDETPEASPAMALGTLGMLVLLLAALIAWWIICARRNRRLDQETDFFEPETDGSFAEQVVF